MRESTEEVLLEAVKRRRSNETFERALSRIMREHHGTYAEYIELIARVRERARKERVSLDEAAKAMAAEGT